MHEYKNHSGKPAKSVSFSKIAGCRPASLLNINPRISYLGIRAIGTKKMRVGVACGRKNVPAKNLSMAASND